MNTQDLQNKRLLLPKVNTVSGERSFNFLAANDWNSLDDGLRNTLSLAAFRARYLKMAFLKMKTSLPIPFWAVLYMRRVSGVVSFGYFWDMG